MSEWLYVVIILTLIVVAAVVLRARRARVGGDLPDRPDASQSSRDYPAERETTRAGALSAEDQAWEAASLERNRDGQARDQTPPGQG